MFTPAQCRAARALIGWSQDQLAGSAKVAKATIANFELSLRMPQDRILDDLQRSLEAAGVEFTNGGQPGVRMASRDSKSSIERPHIASSSEMSVRLRCKSQTGEILIITVERAAIDDCFQLSNSSTQYRRDIVRANLNVIADLAAARYERSDFSRGTSAGSPIVSIVLRLKDLERAQLSLPDPAKSGNW